MNNLPDIYEQGPKVGWEDFAVNENFDDSYKRLNIPDIEFVSDIFRTYRQGEDEINVDYQRKRRVVLEINRNGHHSYPLIVPGDGYLFTIYNDDSGIAQLGTKPVRLVTANERYIVFRGYDALVMGPFGLVNMENTDFGVAIFLENTKIQKIAMYRYDTHKIYEYAHTHKSYYLPDLNIYGSNSIGNNRNMLKSPTSRSEQLATKLVDMYTDNDAGADDLCWDLLDALKDEIDLIPGFSATAEIAMALGWFLEGDHFNTYNEDEKASQITAVGFAQYFLTKAIDSNGGKMGQGALPTLYNLRFNTSWEYNKTMFMLIAHSREEEFRPQSMYMMLSEEIKARRYMLDLQAMYLSDALNEPSILSMASSVNNIFRDEISHYSRGDWQSLKSRGTQYYSDLYIYLQGEIESGNYDF